jgi:hypothetical protein
MFRPTLVDKLNQLAGALSLDEQFKREFMQDRVKAIHRFNTEFAPRYYQKKIELSSDELRLIKAFNFNTIEEFVSLLSIITASYQVASVRTMVYPEVGTASI